VRDVTERKKMEEEKEELITELKALNLELERANKLKDEFLANTSHELRTPLNSTLGLLKLILDGLHRDQDELLEFIRISYRNQEHLLAIINDILDIASIQSGRLELNISEVDVADLFDELNLMFRNDVEKKGLALVIEYPPPGAGVIRSDERRLKQVLSNLIHNAIKFTSAGSIRLSAEPGDGGDVLQFTVEDTGTGFEPGLEEELFRPFVQGDGSSTRNYGGNGLGLAICKKLVEGMNGEIWMESEGAGRGARVVFTVPRDQADEADVGGG
jgi:signal transduction histidine kinase